MARPKKIVETQAPVIESPVTDSTVSVAGLKLGLRVTDVEPGSATFWKGQRGMTIGTAGKSVDKLVDELKRNGF